MVCGWQTKSKAAFSVIIEPLCLFDAPSVCFPTVSVPPSLFLFAAQYLSAFIPCSLSVCFPSLISPSLSVCFPLFSLCVSLRKRLRHCGGGCNAGAGEFSFFFFYQSVIVRAGPSPWIHTHMHPHTHSPQTSSARQMLTTNSQGLAQNKKKPSETGPNSTQLTW